MEGEEKHQIKGLIDKIYDIISVQLIGAAIFIIIALIIKLIGGSFYLEARAVYYENFDNETTIESVTDDTSSDLSSDIADNSSEETNEAEGTLSEILDENTSSETDLLVSTTTPVSNQNSLIWPVVGKITSRFGTREHPIYGTSLLHQGIDVARNLGVQFKAAADGTVYFVGENESLGKYVIIMHSSYFKTLYAHCNEIYAKVGDIVKQGEIIGEVGNTGNVTGSHLHFETIIGGNAINPEWLLPDISSV